VGAVRSHSPSVPELDTALLDGFGFECRDDCGLCCYAEPRVRASERAALLRIVPEAEFVEGDRGTFLASRPDGGACGLLAECRCTAHTARPAPCREFPVTTHLGVRIQATLVLSCPGLDLGGLATWRPGGSSHGRGLDAEVGALRSRIDGSVVRRLSEAARRRTRVARILRSAERWVDEEDVRKVLRRALPTPGPEEFPVEDPPAAEDGLVALPLFFDGRAGPVALATDIGGWHLLELRPGGGVERTIGVVAPPTTVPLTTPDAAAVLEGYLRYWLERDLLFGATHLAMLESDAGDVTEWVAAELRSVGATVLARADVRARARYGERRQLTADDVRDGIRATDQDLLDRDSWGDRL
jgi:Fe-S-cluster containining protein